MGTSEIEISFAKISYSEGFTEESWDITEDERHGKKGFRVCRYLPEPQDEEGSLIWDEWYMFFESIEAAYAAFLSGDLKKGREDF